MIECSIASSESCLHYYQPLLLMAPSSFSSCSSRFVGRYRAVTKISGGFKRCQLICFRTELATRKPTIERNLTGTPKLASLKQPSEPHFRAKSADTTLTRDGCHPLTVGSREVGAED
jgi:hypothetical protein